RRYGREDHPMERATGRRCGGGQELDRSGAGQKEVSDVGNRISDREPGQELLALSGGTSDTTQENRDVQERNEEAVDEAPELQPRAGDVACRPQGGGVPREQSAIGRLERGVRPPGNDREDRRSERRVEEEQDGDRQDRSAPGDPPCTWSPGHQEDDEP